MVSLQLKEVHANSGLWLFKKPEAGHIPRSAAMLVSELMDLFAWREKRWTIKKK